MTLDTSWILGRFDICLHGEKAVSIYILTEEREKRLMFRTEEKPQMKDKPAHEWRERLL